MRHSPTFGAFAATWMEERRSGWKFATLSQYQQVLKSQLLPAFRDTRLSNITESKIRQLLTALQDAGLSARRTNLVLMVLKQILRVAKRRHYLREDPTIDIRDLKEPSTEVDPLDPQEIGMFLAHCPTWWWPYFSLAFWTGARPNELAALKWGNVDWTSSTFRIRAGRYRGVESTPKTAGSVRDVDMLPPVVDAMKTQKAQQATQSLKLGDGAPEVEQDYVFTGPNGGLLNVNFLRDRVWYPHWPRLVYDAESSIRRGTALRAMRWPQEKHHHGSAACSATRHQKCSLGCMRVLSQTRPGGMGSRFSREWWRT